MKFKRVPIKELKLARYNPRRQLVPTDREYQALRRSIQEFGAVEPLIVNKRTGSLVGGHQRLQVLKDIGEKMVDVVEVDLDLRKEKALNVALNKIAGRWDKAKLKDLLVELDDGDLDIGLTGFDAEDLKDMIEDQDGAQDQGDDRIPPPRKKPITKPGDVWDLGPHRILCGDSTKPDNMRILTRGELAALVFTDPPYGVSYKSDKFDAIIGDEKRDENLVNTLLLPAFQNAARATRDDAAFYIWHSGGTRQDFLRAMEAVGIQERQCIIWAKNNFVMGNSDYHWAHEPCFYASKAGHRPKFYGDRTNQTTWTATAGSSTPGGKDLATNVANGLVLVDGHGGQLYVASKPPKGKKLRRIRVDPAAPIFIHHDDARQSVWTVAKDARIDHPTQKPVELAIRALENSSRPDEVVLDLFLGSGCTLIGAERTGRKCYAMEMEPTYVDQAVDRWEMLTGKKAHRVEAEK